MQSYSFVRNATMFVILVDATRRLTSSRSTLLGWCLVT